MSRGYAYILTNDRLNVLYAGSTSNLRKRIHHHKRRLVPGFTKKYNICRLVYFEELSDMVSARRREQQIKGMSRSKKVALIAAVNPEWRDLYEGLARDSTGGNRRDPSLRSG